MDFIGCYFPEDKFKQKFRQNYFKRRVANPLYANINNFYLRKSLISKTKPQIRVAFS